MTCLSLEVLERLVDGAEAPPADAAHLASCAACRDSLAAMRGDADLFASLRAVATTSRPSAVLEGVEPDAIEGYRLVRVLHRGGQGVVYEGVDRTDDRAVAIKVLLGGALTTTRARDRFRRELDLAQRLKHPHIVRPIDHGVIHGAPFYVMRFVEGRHLDDHVREQKASLEQIFGLFTTVCEAIAHAHQRGVIHCDLKPANIVVDGDGAPHVLDFGVAQSVRAGTQCDAAAAGFAGTLAYAAPEQLGADGGDLTLACDVYSLGVILYELLTGHLPHRMTGDLSQVLTTLRRGRPDEPRFRGERLEPGLRALLFKALAKDPADRYPSAEALAADARRVMAGEGLAGGRASWWSGARRAFGRHRRAILVTASVVLITASVVGTVLYLYLHAEHQRRTATQIQAALNEILAAANPDRMGAGVALVDVLGEAARVIDASLDRAPDVRAAVQLTIGDTYRRLFRMQQARPHLEAALARYRAIDGDPPLEVARVLHLLGLVLIEQDDVDAADLLEEALAIRQRAFGDANDDVAATRRALGLALARRSVDRDRPRARRLISSARAHFERRPGAEAELARTLHLQAQLSANEGDVGQAEPLFRRAVSLFDGLVEGDGRAIECFNAFASFLVDRQRFSEAEAYLERSSRLARTLFGEERAANVLRHFARLEYARRDYRAAEAFSLRAIIQQLRFCAKQRRPDAAHLAALERRLAPGLATADARDALLGCVRFLREYYGKGAFEIAVWTQGLARVEHALGRSVFAQSLLEEALTFHCRVFGSDCPVRCRGLQFLASLRVAVEDHDAALPLLEEAHAICRRLGRSESEAGREILRSLVACRAASKESHR